MTDLSVADYSEKAIVVRGESTRSLKEELKTLGGKYNASLRDGPGWIFPKKKEDKVLAFVASGKLEGEAPVAKPSRSVQPDSDVIDQTITYMSSLTPNEKLACIARIVSGVTGVISVTSVTPVKVSPPQRVVKTFAKPAVSSKTFAKPATEVASDCDDDEEDVKPRPRLLG